MSLLGERRQRLLVIGLDCAAPELVFRRWRDDLPNLKRLLEGGLHGVLYSCIPCITVPAWSVMMSGKDPGMLGIYGFRNRADYSYDRLAIATSSMVKEPRVWDILGRADKRVVTIGVPGTYPPQAVNGAQISCFLTPQVTARDEQGKLVTRIFTYPAELSAQVNAWAGGEYRPDVKQFRTDDKESLLQQIYAMTRQHFQVVLEMLTREDWDFFMFVEMGPDRMHHGFWKYFDPAHSGYMPDSPYAEAIRNYYVYLDGEIGKVLARLDGETAVMVVSDHGVQKMEGGICVNEWLRREGLLTLAGPAPETITPIDKVEIDWGRTQVWGEGGYYARIFMNVAGREPQGVIPAADYEHFRDELVEKIKSLRGTHGEDIGTQVYKPQHIYREIKGVPPDLIVYWGNLSWRSVGSLGHPQVWTFENDTGPDDANHAPEGIFVYYDPQRHLGGQELAGLDIMDVAPTVLEYFGLPVPPDMQGCPIFLRR